MVITQDSRGEPHGRGSQVRCGHWLGAIGLYSTLTFTYGCFSSVYGGTLATITWVWLIYLKPVLESYKPYAHIYY